jgi:hypothetical protein
MQELKKIFWESQNGGFVLVYCRRHFDSTNFHCRIVQDQSAVIIYVFNIIYESFCRFLYYQLMLRTFSRKCLMNLSKSIFRSPAGGVMMRNRQLSASHLCGVKKTVNILPTALLRVRNIREVLKLQF